MYNVVLITNQFNNIAPITRILELNGYQIIRAADALSGLWYIEHSEPDLILLDIDLFDLHGSTIASRLNHLSNHIPVMALTTSTTVADYQVALACGCSVIFTQPLDISRFLREIAEFLPVSA